MCLLKATLSVYLSYRYVHSLLRLWHLKLPPTCTRLCREGIMCIHTMYICMYEAVFAINAIR